MTFMMKRACIVLVTTFLIAAVTTDAEPPDWDSLPSSVRTAKRRYDSSVERAASARDKAATKADEILARAEETAAKALLAEIKGLARKASRSISASCYLSRFR